MLIFGLVCKWKKPHTHTHIQGKGSRLLKFHVRIAFDKLKLSIAVAIWYTHFIQSQWLFYSVAHSFYFSNHFVQSHSPLCLFCIWNQFTAWNSGSKRFAHIIYYSQFSFIVDNKIAIYMYYTQLYMRTFGETASRDC